MRSCLRNVPLLGTNSFAFGFCKNISRGKQKVQFSVGRKNKNSKGEYSLTLVPTQRSVAWYELFCF